MDRDCLHLYILHSPLLSQKLCHSLKLTKPILYRLFFFFFGKMTVFKYWNKLNCIKINFFSCLKNQNWFFGRIWNTIKFWVTQKWKITWRFYHLSQRRKGRQKHFPWIICFASEAPKNAFLDDNKINILTNYKTFSIVREIALWESKDAFLYAQLLSSILCNVILLISLLIKKLSVFLKPRWNISNP